MTKQTELTTCERCHEAVVLQANGDLACSCDYVDHRPLGEIPDWWTISDEDFAAWSEAR